MIPRKILLVQGFFVFTKIKITELMSDVISLAAIIFYIFIALQKIYFPAPHYDEVLYVNAAVGFDSKTFITASIGSVPVLLMPYIGALKSYLYFPIFALFGVSILTIRLPAILLTAVALYLLYRLLKKIVGSLLSVCILFLTALDASFIIFTRLDFGPVVIDFFLKITALFFLWSYIKTLRLIHIILFWVTMSLGVFNKLNFVWYLNAYIVAFIIIYGKSVLKKVAGEDKKILFAVSVLGYFVIISYILIITRIFPSGQKTFKLVDPSLFLYNLEAIVTGSWFYNYALSYLQIRSLLIFLIISSVIISGILILVLTRSTRIFSAQFVRFFVFLGIVLVLLLGQIAITYRAIQGWHYFSIYPFFGMLFVISLYFLLTYVLKQHKFIIKASLVIIIILVNVYQLFIYGLYLKAFNEQIINADWSPAIYTLVDFTKAKSASKFISVDWGIHTQLIALDPVKDKYFEIHREDLAKKEELFQSYFLGKPGAYYISHTPEKETIYEVRKEFFELAKNKGYNIVEVMPITDGYSAIFNLYRFSI